MRALVVLGSLVACGGGGDPPGEPALFPASYRDSYTEVRNCRFSIDHDSTRIRVLAAPDALGPYMDRTTPFPPGAIVLKEQYDSRDTTCSGPLVRYTVMQKLAGGTDPGALDWQWQEANPKVEVVEQDLQRCIACHTDCGKPPDGYDGTCTVP